MTTHLSLRRIGTMLVAAGCAATGLVAPPAHAAPVTPAATYRTSDPYQQAGWQVSQLVGGRSGGRRVAIVVEKGVKVDARQAANYIMGTLNDPRGWAGKGVKWWAVKDTRDAQLVIHITSPARTDRECYPLKTAGYVSCAKPRLVFLNSNRWLYGVPHIKNLDTYKKYLISHEVGHTLGYRHARCPGKGRPAPVMQQQTYGLQGCTANPWVTVRLR